MLPVDDASPLFPHARGVDVAPMRPFVHQHHAHHITRMTPGVDASPLLAHARGVGGIYIHMPQWEQAANTASLLLGFLHTSHMLPAGVALMQHWGKFTLGSGFNLVF